MQSHQTLGITAVEVSVGKPELAIPAYFYVLGQMPLLPKLMPICRWFLLVGV
jgi:hypothetical protein